MYCKFVADDYGMSREVNNAIADLVRRGIVSKTSVMANESCQYSLMDIENIDKGLHVNLSSYDQNGGINQNECISPLKSLYSMYSKKLAADHIMDSFKKQYKFLDDKGMKISYIDSHLHLHAIPKLLDLLIVFAQSRGINSIRCITMEGRHLFYYLYSLFRFGFLTHIPKIVILYTMGFFMRRKMENARILCCKNLVLMPLATRGDYPGLLKELFNRFKNEDAEIVIHPGLETETQYDIYTDGRYIEYRSLLNLK